MKQVLNGLDARLVKRILKTVEVRMEGRSHAGLWTHEDENPEYFKETIASSRAVLIDMTPSELRRLRRIIAGESNELTPREEGLRDELAKFVLDVGKHGSENINRWLARFSEIVMKMKGK